LLRGNKRMFYNISCYYSYFTSKIDFYRVLESPRDASYLELKKNYQRLVLECHPDKANQDSKKFELLQKAWETLRDSKTRSEYDNQLQGAQDCKL
jgi:DnaJ-class molecular chaperone